MGFGHDLPGVDFDPFNLRLFSVTQRTALPDPTGQHAVITTTDGESGASLMRHFAGSLGQEQTVFRSGRKKTTTPVFVDQPVIVFPWLIPEQGKAEAILTT